MTAPDLTNLTWHKEMKGIAYQVSTSRHLLDLDFINAAFASDDMPWARSLPGDQLSKTLDFSLTLGLYAEEPCSPERSTDEPSSPRTPSPSLEAMKEFSSKQIGMARLITDHITFAYLTDVYVAPEYRRFGLARWLMTCLKEVLEQHPAIRRSMCVSSLEYGTQFYKETLGFHNMTEEAPLLALTGKFKPRQ